MDYDSKVLNTKILITQKNFELVCCHRDPFGDLLQNRYDSAIASSGVPRDLVAQI